MLPTDLAATPDQVVWPRYEGRSLLNLVTSLAGHFGVDTGHAPWALPLPLDGVDTVVLFVADGLGHFLLGRHLEAGDLPHLAARLAAGEGSYQSATSTFPSSTMTAMTTLHTGASPAQHGWLGTALHWRGQVADVLRQRELTTGQPLADARALCAVPSLYRRLADASVATCAVSLAAFEGSFLNAWYFDGATSVPYDGELEDLPAAAVRAAQGGGPRYVLAYWPGYDGVCHQVGHDAPEAAAAARAIDAAFHELLESLPQSGRTLVVFTADHGQSVTPAPLALALEDVPTVAAALRGPPAGENLVRYLNTVEGATGLTEALQEHATVMAAQEAWDGGLFGGLPAQASFQGRTGDVIAVAHRGHQLTWAYPAQPARVWAGTHGGWSAEQMVVPVIAFRR